MTRLEAAIAELVAAIREEATPVAGSVPETLYSVEEAADRLGIGRTMAYRELAAGRLASIRVGRRRLVASSAIADYVAARSTAA